MPPSATNVIIRGLKGLIVPKHPVLNERTVVCDQQNSATDTECVPHTSRRAHARQSAVSGLTSRRTYLDAVGGLFLSSSATSLSQTRHVDTEDLTRRRSLIEGLRSVFIVEPVSVEDTDIGKKTGQNRDP